MGAVAHVLVTGAAGRIGSAVTAHLRAAGVAVTGLSLGFPDSFVAERLVTGDTTTEESVATALDAASAGLPDIDGVVHLAALPHPKAGTPFDVYRTNVVSTFNVLAQAGAKGIRRAVIASSINAFGVPMNSHDVLPAYYPLDEQVPADIDDWYSLSKAADELTASMASRHWGIDVLAYRFPATTEWANLKRHSAGLTDRPGNPGSVREGWSYLDVRDAAKAVYLGLITESTGAQVVFVAAPNTLVPYPTQELLERYAPAVPRLRRFVGREVPIDLTVAKSLIGFEAEHVLDLPGKELPAGVNVRAGR